MEATQRFRFNSQRWTLPIVKGHRAQLLQMLNDYGIYYYVVEYGRAEVYINCTGEELDTVLREVFPHSWEWIKRTAGKR